MQFVGYEPSGRGSALLVADGGSVEAVPLEPGAELSYALGPRHCAGTIADGEHVPCDRSTAPYCDHHTNTWVCARCTGTCLKPEMDCYQEHAVYVAAFAPDTFKVGVTKSRRLETRLREQGADRAAHVHTVSNGRIARELESEIATRLVDRVRTDRKVASLARSVDEAAWEDALAEFDVIDRFDLEYGLGLDRRPIRETIASGTVVGVKGRLLVLENGATTYAVDLRDLVGYEIATGMPSGNRQSSLGSFG
ncbi:DUF2797 domain-containing protein [Natronococcus sp. JC468]|uniref:DUF2797 domain-containing protein n=1 Tax=Natronococcus sp. JC468 TaxID=1961921 RepID=UPI00143C0454|nr:DUF2797 domain-containing protein [Natronococcus sp. JC468]NKE35946.1 DUF2797 domain-containing protein [Natronococcus sp. JC468]